MLSIKEFYYEDKANRVIKFTTFMILKNDAMDIAYIFYENY